MTNLEMIKIEEHINSTNSGWWNFIERFSDGIMIEHGNDLRKYKKFIKIT